MSIPDELMWSYYELVTDRTPQEIAALKQEVASGKLHPRDAKIKLATEIVDDFHTPNAEPFDSRSNTSATITGEANLPATIGTNTAAEFNRVYRDRQAPSDLPENYIRSEPGKMRLSRALVRLGATDSRAEAERLIKQGAVEIDGGVIADPTFEFDLSVPRKYLLKVGKKKHFYLVVQG
jgi:tyrosyl-tRNA synthetase